ncbi:MAG: exo-beta-N-acetylmuramidase NamZ domain-containing protein [Phycisphaerae bacterium]
MSQTRISSRHIIPLTLLVAAITEFYPATARVASADEFGSGVLTGIDVLVRDGFRQLNGRKVGLITNQTGVDRFGRSTIELLQAAPNVELAALFSPEHGLKGVLEEKVADSTDPLTGLKVYSLYGNTYRPTAEMLEGIDTLVFDIQEIGTRFYTYIATMGYAMQEAAEHNIRFVVLDRPNPITGVRVFGPINDRDGKFTAYHPIPLVHGMTVGELARMFNTERKINANLQVIRMEGWRRSMWFDETLLLWVNPSPNMRSLTEATLYPAIGLIEACKVSVGRGTDTPFERFGAPWIDGRRLAARLNGLGLEGIRFIPYRFTPNASKFTTQECGGVQIVLTDRDAFDPIETGLSIVRELKDLFGDSFDVDRVDRLLFNKDVLEKVKASTSPTGYRSLWQKKLDAFMTTRSQYLLYE